MSEKEFDQGNEELFGVVNAHADPEAAKAAEKIEKDLKRGSIPSATAQWEEVRRLEMRRIKRRHCMRAVCRIMACVLAAALFTGALIFDNLVPVLCYLGIAVCISILSVLIDRNTRGW